MAAEDERNAIKRHHRRHIPLIASPIAKGGTHHTPASHDSLDSSERQPLEITESISHHDTKTSVLSKVSSHVRGQSDRADSHPAFERHAEATPSELFYDLFFVANLTAFTGKHEINNKVTLYSYIGFFAVLWFTWFQVSLYDLRFSKDTVFDRICKALQFGFMVGFMVISTNFDPHDGVVDVNTFSLLLMGSRLVLFLQYTVAGLYVLKWPTVRVPMLATAAIIFASAMVYLGLAFSTPEANPNSYIAWYALALIEGMLSIGASCYWRVLSYKGTHIVERMSLLTLIILGEGVIGIGEAIQESVGDSNIVDFSPAVVGIIVSATLLLYFLYMLYFDNLPEEHFGTIRQQIWAIVHFPLHLALVLFVQGSASFIKWQRSLDVSFALSRVLIQDRGDLAYLLYDTLGPIPAALNTTESFEGLATHINATAQEYFVTYAKGLGPDTVEGVYESLEFIANGTHESFTQVSHAYDNIFLHIITMILDTFGIEISDLAQETIEAEAGTGGTAGLSQFEALYKLFNIVYIYFLVTGGLALMLLGGLAYMSQAPKKRAYDYVRCAAFEVVGLTLALLALVDLPMATSDFPFTPWVVPAVMLLVGFIALLNQF